MVDDRSLSREEIEAWIHKHLAGAPERDDAWLRDVLNIRASGVARLRKAKELAAEAEAA